MKKFLLLLTLLPACQSAELKTCESNLKTLYQSCENLYIDYTMTIQACSQMGSEL